MVSCVLYLVFWEFNTLYDDLNSVALLKFAPYRLIVEYRGICLSLFFYKSSKQKKSNGERKLHGYKNNTLFLTNSFQNGF